jgi:hypothetical protein
MTAYDRVKEELEKISGIKMKDMDAGEIFGKLIGFASSDLSDVYDQTNAIRNLEARRRDRRGLLIDLMVQPKDEGSRVQTSEIQQKIDRWNSTNSKNKITPRTIFLTRRSRNSYERKSTYGIRKTKQNRDLIERFDFAN